MTLLETVRAAVVRPDLAIFHRFVPPPWGGSNTFLLALRGELQRRGLRVSENLVGASTRGCILNAFAFDADALRRQRRPGLRVLHRVDGPVGTYRGTGNEVDGSVQALNAELADATVFQSQYSLEAHAALGLGFREPVVVPNAVDPRLFHPQGRRAFDPQPRVKLISTTWSDNPNKGTATYTWLDEHLDFARYEYTFVGRSPVRFRNIRMVPPVGSRELGELLRAHDVYVTASLHDPCSNALIEALSCGLPALFARSGGHPELVGAGGLGFDRADEIPDLLDGLVARYDDFRRAIAVRSLAEVADAYLRVLRWGAGSS